MLETAAAVVGDVVAEGLNGFPKAADDGSAGGTELVSVVILCLRGSITIWPEGRVEYTSRLVYVLGYKLVKSDWPLEMFPFSLDVPTLVGAYRL